MNEPDEGWVISETQTSSHCLDHLHYEHWQGQVMDCSCHSTLQSRQWIKYYELPIST